MKRFLGMAPRTAVPAVSGVLVLIALIAATPVSAQPPPDAPRPIDSCTASLTLDPPVIPFIGGRPVELRVSGLEPGAAYHIFVGSRFFGGGLASGDGAAVNVIVVETLTAARLDVQVATTGRCAVATLTVVGPLRVRCETLTIDGFLPLCPIPVRGAQ
jgi:hypothetical protein